MMNLDTSTISLLLTTIFSVGGLAWYLSKELNTLKDFVYKQTEKVKESMIEKIEYHERHDDKRFSDIVNDIWELRLRHAAVEGLLLKKPEIKSKGKINPTD